MSEVVKRPELPKAETVELKQNTADFFTDLEAIRLSTEDLGGIGIKKIVTNVPVQKPALKTYFRCHPDERMSHVASLFVPSREEDDQVYYVAPEMRDVLAGEFKAVRLQLAITRRGNVFIWPLTIPNDDNKLGRRWHLSAFKAAQIAQSTWIKIKPDNEISGYHVTAAEGQLDEPEWPEGLTFNDYLRIAFEDRIIRTRDHPAMLLYRGIK